MALNSLLCAHVPLRNCSLTHLFYHNIVCVFVCVLDMEHNEAEKLTKHLHHSNCFTVIKV